MPPSATSPVPLAAIMTRLDVGRRRRWHRHLRRMAALTAAAVTVLLVPGSALPTAQAEPPTALSGAYSGGGDASGVGAFGTWRGAASTVGVDFIDPSTWSTVTDPTWVASQWAPSPARLSLAIPMLPNSGGSMATGASGGYNTYFRTLATRLVASGQSDAIIRLGWEMNGGWYSWSAVASPGTYIAYWRQVVTTMRSVTGTRFLFDWSPASGYGAWGFDTASAYPGDAYVDIIGADLYDQHWGISSSEPVKRWADFVARPYGLNWLASFSATHNKPISFPEWGLSWRSDGHGGGDDPYYITQMHSWIKNHRVLYEAYFDKDINAGEKHAINNGMFPDAAKEYKRLWATSTSPVLVPASTVMVSWYSDRRDAKPLNGMGLNSSVYVYLGSPSTSTSKVAFYLDDPTRVRAPLRTEFWAPFDLMGGAPAAAVAFDTTKLARGTHTLTTVVTTSTSTAVTTATFTL